ncbi:non-ribosomal peptide synthetase [Bacillus horti]|uniref:Surfactin family lipopeptide synthetase A n=1 Tax=Caldalkalibacillus horti TaxID=77523 RepID=A0ABT9W537_9BACI|nr:non-ribosomal peptide synthetase [Bacillus horti]MDQ0168368.1 surfactin family lipopeptide synthetase A [Bacillus horti]
MVDKIAQNLMLSDYTLNEEKEYWLQKLEGEISFSGFPVDYYKPRVNEGLAKITIPIPEPLFNRMNTMCNHNMHGLYMILVSGVKALLYKYTDNEDIMIGMPSFQQTESEETMAHIIALRSKIEHEQSFRFLLSDIRSSVLEADQHQSIPFNVLAGLKQESWNESEGFQTIVAFNAIHNELHRHEIETNTLFYFERDDSQLYLHLFYHSHLYQQETVDRLGEQLLLIYAQTLTDPEISIKDISLVTDDQEKELLSLWKENEVKYPPSTIHELFAQSVRLFPNRVALSDGQKELTYAEVDQWTNRLAHTLIEKGLQREQLVAVVLERSLEMVMSALAILKAGGAYVPIDPSYPIDRILYTLEDSAANLVLTQPEVKNVLHLNVGITVIDVHQQEALSKDDSPLPNRNEAEDLAYIIYTSGTTGKPKGVMIEHENVVRLLHNEAFQFDFNERDVWTLFHSFCFDFSVWEMYGALLYGGKLVVVQADEARDPAKFINVLLEEQVSVLNQTPTAFAQLVEEHMKDTKNNLDLRYVIFGGEALKPGGLKSWKRRYPECKLINMYGITETTVHVTYKEITEYEIEHNISNIGKPIPTLSTYIFDTNQQVLPVGLAGELYVGGAGVGRGYLHRPELSAEKFIQNPYRSQERLYRTGDLARLLTNGEMEYLGRIDHQVKIRGFRIELGEVETVLLQHQAIQEAAVLTKKHQTGESYICAYYVLKEVLSEWALREYMATLLPEYMIPSYLVEIDRFPVTSNGKIDRKLLPDPKERLAAELDEPSNEVEQLLEEICAEVIGIDRVGVRQPFFHVGGDSIKAVSYVNKINNAFHVQLQVKDIYVHQSIQQLSQAINELMRSSEGTLSEAEATPHSGIQEATKELIELQEKIRSSSELSAHIKDTVEDFYPMSDIERGMVYYALANPNLGIYHDQFIYYVTDASFDIPVFEKAIDMLTKKHDILRASFNLKDFEIPMKLIHTSISLNLSYADIRTLTNEQQKSHIQEDLQRDRAKSFDPHTAPLWRMKVYQLTAEKWCLAWIFHHAILDGWSNASFMTELSNTYFRLKEDPSYTVEPLLSHYRSYIIEQTVLKKDPKIKEFWKSELSEYKRLPLPKRNVHADVNERKTYSIPLKKELLEQLKKMELMYQTDIKTLCFSAYVSMCSMLSYERDFVVGLIENNRPICEDSDKILGCFLNTVPVRIRLDKSLTWGEHVRAISQKLVDIKYYGRLPLFEILKELKESSQDGNPLFDTIYNYVDFTIYEKMEHRETEAAPIELQANEKTNTLFDFTLLNTFNQFSVHVIYSPVLFDESAMEKVIHYFIKALEHIAYRHEAVIKKQDLLSAEEQRLFVHDLTLPKQEQLSKKSIPDLFEEQVRQYPHKMAVVCAEQELTYESLNEYVQRLAQILQEKGISSGDIVGLMTSHSLETVVGALAILKAGAALVALDPEYPHSRIEHMIDDSQIKVLLTDDKTSSSYPFQGTVINVLEQLGDGQNNQSAGNALPEWTNPGENDLAYLIYTSGSTGKPKGVMVEHKGLANLKSVFEQVFGITPNDRILQFASSSFDASIWEMSMALLTGATLYIPTKEVIMSTAKFESFMNQHEITAATLPPTYVSQLEPTRLNTLKKLITAGSAISAELVHRWKGHVHYFNAYGPTEYTICTTIWDSSLSYFDGSIVPIGRPIYNTHVYVLDQQLEPQPIGVEGELCVTGVALARGYLNRSELTAEKFVKHPLFPNQKLYRTGDLVRWSEDGNLEFLGRLDHQVKVRGHRVETGEIENSLLKIDSVTEVVVLDREDANGQKYLCAYFVADQQLEHLKLRGILLESLPDYMVPAHFIQIEEMPLTPNDKIDRRALPAPESKRLTEGREYLAPTTDIEKLLAEIWQTVLGVSQLGVEESFFELGGDSIKAIQVSARLHEKGYALEISSIFQYPSIQQLAEQVTRNSHQVDQGSVQGYFSLTPIQKWLFEENQSIHYFNQSIMLHHPEGFEAAILMKVLEQVVEHHDGLRMCFKNEDGQTVGYIQGLDETPAFDFISYDLKNESGTTLSNRIEEYCTALQQSFVLERGPLFKVTLFKTQEGDHLMLLLHHSIVDGVSWRILLEDVSEAYSQELNQQEIRFPQKTDSYLRWSNMLYEYAQSNELLREIDYWAELERVTCQRLPVNENKTSYTNLVRDGANTSFKLSTEDTQALLNQTHQAYNTEMNDILLTALGRTVYKWTGHHDILIQLEGHGREAFLKDMNISRTLGWFTSTYPVLIKLDHTRDSEEENLAYHIKSTKEMLRKIPNKGVGYSLLKYVTPSELTNRLSFDIKPEINFNYLGQFMEQDEKSVIKPSSMSTGQSVSPEFFRPSVLDFSGMISNGSLEFHLNYNTHQFSERQMEEVINLFKTELLHIIEHCRRVEQKQMTPTDMGNSELSIEELEDITDFFNDLE